MALSRARKVLHPHSPAVVPTNSPPAILAPALELRGRPTTSAAGVTLAVSPTGMSCLPEKARRGGVVRRDTRAIGSVRLMAKRRLMAVGGRGYVKEGVGTGNAVRHRWDGEGAAWRDGRLFTDTGTAERKGPGKGVAGCPAAMSVSPTARVHQSQRPPNLIG